MKRGILITCYYPPDGGVGAQRPRKLVEYARNAGWEITVVTRESPARRSSWEPEDRSLADKEHSRVIRLPFPPQTSAGAMVPGPHGADDPYLSSVVACVRELLDSEPCDAIILTMPPYGMSPVIPAIQTFCQVPVFIDLRDPWALDGAPSYRNKAQWSVTNQWMQKVLGHADGVIANTPEAGVQIRNAIRELEEDQVEVINNGCTLSEFQGPLPSRPDAMDPQYFHLVHTGTLHSHAFERTRGLVGKLRSIRNYRAGPVSISGRTAYHLLRAIDLLRRRNEECLENFRLSLVGVKDESTRRIVDESPSRDLVQLIGFVPFHESIAWIRNANALFLPLFGLPKGRRSRIVPSKCYEYIASGNPILGALPEGDARDLVQDTGRGYIADPCDDAAIADTLLQVIHHARSLDSRLVPDPSSLEPFDWERLCRRFFSFIDKRIGVIAREQRQADSIVKASS